MDVFDLYAKLSLDSKDYDRSLQNASNAAEQWQTKMVMAAKAVGSALSGAVSGISKLIGSSVDAFSSFQQLQGGVETIFGAGGKSFEEWSDTFKESSDSMQDYIETAKKVWNGDFGVGTERRDLLAAAGYDPDTIQQMVDNLVHGIDVATNVSAETISANIQTAEEKYESLTRAQNNVMQNARKAFKTTGLSANEYMNTVTTFSASLIQGLKGDTEKASMYADRAMQDMSDNANKMGTDMGAIMNAYQGFSKQNYTMLDNLKLGYGGTKTEMERLIQDAAKLTDVQEKLGITVDANSMSFDNIVNAISVVQENMGITGTTAKEAATTIEGSTKMMKASWQNMLTAMVTGGDWFDSSINDLVESVFTFAHNVIPAIEGAMHGVASLISKLAPLIASELPAFIDDMLPEFINAISAIIGGIIDALPSLISALGNIMPILTENISNLIPSIIDLILEGVPLLIEAGITLLTGLVSGITDNIETIIPQLTQGIIDMVDHISQIVSSGGVGLAAAGLALLSGLANALVDAVPNVLTQITQLVQDLTASIGNIADGEGGNFLTTATTILENLVDGLMESIPTLVPQLTEAVATFITQFADIAASNTTDFTNTAISILNSLVTSLGNSGTISSVMTNITTAVMAIIEAIINVITNIDAVTFANACASIVSQLADGIVSAIGVITDRLPELITGIVAWLTNPENITGIFEAAITIGGKLLSKVPEIIESLASALAGIVTGIANYFKDNGDEILQGFKDGFANIGTKVSELWEEDIKPAFTDLGTHFIDWFTQFEWGQTIVDFISGITKEFAELWNKIKDSFEGEGGIGYKIKNFFTTFQWGETLTNFINGIGNTFAKAWDSLKDAFTGENGFFGKIKSWFGEFDLTQIISDFIQKIKSAIEGAWDGFKQWFQEKIGGLFSGIKVPNWIKKLFGKGEGDAEDPTQMDAEDEKLVDMPENMLTIDYSNLEPIPDETLESFKTFADTIQRINSTIGGGEEGGLGLNGILSGLPALFTNAQTSAQAFADYLATGFVTSVQTLMKFLCLTSEDEEGNIKAGGGNTLYNAMGSIYGLFQDLWHTSQQLANHWTTEFIQASELMRTEAGYAIGVVQDLASTAQNAASQFASLTAEILGAVDAYIALEGVGGTRGGGGGKSGWGKYSGKRASGGEVNAGDTYLVGEKGPELYTPSRSGYIVNNDDLMNRKQEINVTVNFDGDVIGDEDSISSYVTKACTEAIKEAVYAGA